MKALTTLMAAIAMLASTQAHAGMVVSDPVSYTYYVEEIKKMATQVEQGAKQIETLGGVLTTANDINNKMMGHYNRAQNLVRRMDRLQKVLTRDTHGDMFERLKQIGDAGRSTGGVMRGTATEAKYAGQDYAALTGEDLFADTRKVLEWNFGDPRDQSDPMAKYRTADAKYQAQQEALKNVVATSQATLGGIKDRMDTINDLAGQVNQTANMKDAQDLTNALLVEVLKTLTDMLAVAAQANQAAALFNYNGATDKTFAERQKVLAGIGATVGKSELEIMLQGGDAMAADGKMPSKF